MPTSIPSRACCESVFMCLIIDTNRTGILAKCSSGDSSEPSLSVLKWMKGDGMVVYGGSLSDEYDANSTQEFRRLLAEWNRSGKARLEDPDKVRRVSNSIKAKCESNDADIVALARVSGARLLWTCDNDLMKDFLNSELVFKPNGKVLPERKVTPSNFEKWLKHTSGCPRGRIARS